MISRLLAAILLSVVLLMLAADLAPYVHAGEGLTVTKTEDTNDGACDSDCSLREAVIAANASPGVDTIVLGPDTYTLSIAGASEDNATTGDLDVIGDVTITGAGVGQTVIDAARLDRVLTFSGSTTGSTLSSLTITGGQEDVFGTGGIWNLGTLTLDHVRVTDNQTTSGVGGIMNDGTLTIRDSSIDDNHAQIAPGGLSNREQGVAVIESSTLSGNTSASPDHAGAAIRNSGTTNIVNSTLSGNVSGGGGGAAQNIGEGQLTIANATIAGNTGLEALRTVGSAHTTLRNTIIAGNGGNQCFTDTSAGAVLTSNGHNLASDGTCNLAAAGDLPNATANLGALAHNGGPTRTHALLPGSAAIDAGDPAACPDEDQRGEPRVGVCDIGAFEFVPTSTWGDLDCDGEISTRDNQGELRFVLNQNVLSQTEPCPDIGSTPDISAPSGGAPLQWGDVDCDGEISSRDNQALLRHVLAQNALSQTEPCPDVGSTIDVSGP